MLDQDSHKRVPKTTMPLNPAFEGVQQEVRALDGQIEDLAKQIELAEQQNHELNDQLRNLREHRPQEEEDESPIKASHPDNNAADEGSVEETGPQVEQEEPHTEQHPAQEDENAEEKEEPPEGAEFSPEAQAEEAQEDEQ